MTNTIDVKPRYWPRADERKMVDGVDTLCASLGFGNEPFLNNLPQEFYLHELMDIDPTSNKAVETFARKWGMPYHPTRWCNASLIYGCGYDLGAISELIAETEKAAKNLGKQEYKALNIESDSYIGPSCSCLSIREASEALSFLQRLVNCLDMFLIGETPQIKDLFMLWSIQQTAACNDDLFFNGASYSEMFRSTRDGIPDFTITNAIANQIFETAKDDIPYRRCAWCGRNFKYRRSSTTKPAKTTRKQSSSIYCCQKCYQSMKDYRNWDIKTPPDWWTPEQAEAERSKGKRKK